VFLSVGVKIGKMATKKIIKQHNQLQIIYIKLYSTINNSQKLQKKTKAPKLYTYISTVQFNKFVQIIGLFYLQF
jgi:hypothetical protein